MVVEHKDGFDHSEQLVDFRLTFNFSLRQKDLFEGLSFTQCVVFATCSSRSIHSKFFSLALVTFTFIVTDTMPADRN